MSMYSLFTDHLGRNLHCSYPPQRVISLCPSITETLVALGIGNRLVGRTRFCIHPLDQLAGVAKVGGTKAIHYHRVRSLHPDLIIAQKEENTLSMIQNLEREFPVYVTDVNTLEDGYRLVRDVGKLIDASEMANAMTQELRKSINQSEKKGGELGTVLYFIWKEPWIVAGANTYIQGMLEHAGFDNLGKSLGSGRYPEVTKEDVLALHPQRIFLSSEPYPFRHKHLQDMQSWLPDSKIHLVDGEMFSWYGARMKPAGDYLLHLQEACLA